MKRLLAALFLALVASLALALNAASATHSNGHGPKQDLAAGTGQLESSDPFSGQVVEQKVHVSANSGPMGEDPQGDFRVEAMIPSGEFDIDFRGRVTCLHVIGNRATVGGEVERSNDDRFPEGSGILIHIRDDDEGAGDSFSLTRPQTPPQTCQNFRESFEPNTQGNFIVHDATTP